MRNLTFAVGLATGYVLGARAGQERYEQIAKSARGIAGHPAVVRAQSKATNLIGAATVWAITKIGSVGDHVTCAGGRVGLGRSTPCRRG